MKFINPPGLGLVLGTLPELSPGPRGILLDVFQRRNDEKIDILGTRIVDPTLEELRSGSEPRNQFRIL
jgi:hypothetical protein